MEILNGTLNGVGKGNSMLEILIIEDDDAIAGLISKTLVSAGYSCTIAEDGEKGEDAFDSRKWDLVLLDLMLPVVSGYELLEYIRPTKTPCPS